MFEWQGCKLMMPTLFCTQSDRVSAAQSWRLARMKCFYNSYQQQCFVAQRIFFNPTLASWLPTKAVLWKEVFAPCLLIFFSALSLVQSSNGGQISKIGFLHLSDDGSCWTTTLQFLPPTTKRKSTIGDATLTHTPTCTPSQATEHIGLMYVLLLHFVAQMARFVRSPKLQIWSLPPWNIFDILNWHRWIKHPRLQGWSFYKVLGILNWCSLIKHPGLQGWNFYNVFGILNWHRWIRFFRHFCCFFVPWATLWS